MRLFFLTLEIRMYRLKMITGALPPTSQKIASVENGQDPVIDGYSDALMVMMFVVLASLAIICFWKLYWNIMEDTRSWIIVSDPYLKFYFNFVFLVSFFSIQLVVEGYI